MDDGLGVVPELEGRTLDFGGDEEASRDQPGVLDESDGSDITYHNDAEGDQPRRWEVAGHGRWVRSPPLVADSAHHETNGQHGSGRDVASDSLGHSVRNLGLYRGGKGS